MSSGRIDIRQVEQSAHLIVEELKNCSTLARDSEKIIQMKCRETPRRFKIFEDNVHSKPVGSVSQETRCTLRVGVQDRNWINRKTRTKMRLNNELHHCAKFWTDSNCAELGHELQQNYSIEKQQLQSHWPCRRPLVVQYKPSEEKKFWFNNQPQIISVTLQYTLSEKQIR